MWEHWGLEYRSGLVFRVMLYMVSIPGGSVNLGSGVSEGVFCFELPGSVTRNLCTLHLVFKASALNSHEALD